MESFLEIGIPCFTKFTMTGRKILRSVSYNRGIFPVEIPYPDHEKKEFFLSGI
jgi:hypothetical protein